MAGELLTTRSLPIPDKVFTGGLNSTSNPLNLQDSESPDLQNIDFDKFGSLLKRNGYIQVNGTAFNSGSPWTSLYWFQRSDGNRYLMGTCGDKVGVWLSGITGSPSDITGSVTIANDQNILFQWTTFLNTAIGTNGNDLPIKWNGIGGMVTGITVADGGTSYVNGDILTLQDGNYDCHIQIGTIGGVINSFNILESGGAYGVANNVLGYGGNGTGAKFDVTSVSSNCVLAAAPSSLTTVKWVNVYQNFVIYANVTVDGVVQASRIYWSKLREIYFDDLDFVDINKDDGQTITGVGVLADRLVVFKERSIWVGTFTGDVDIPFNFIKSLSEVGCINGYSIQNAVNGLIFQAPDGIYFFDGYSSTKLSYRIQTTLDNLNKARIVYGQSVYQYEKNRYWLGISSSDQSKTDKVITFDTYNNAFSLYAGNTVGSTYYPYGANCFARAYTSGKELIYFGDYNGYVYLADTGLNDNPAGTEVPINAYYYTKWWDEGDITNQKKTEENVLYYDFNSAQLTVNYSYDLSNGDDYLIVINTTNVGGYWDVSLWDIDFWGGSGGAFYRMDLDGRGRLIRFKFSNKNANETFKINGMGRLVYVETNV